MDEAKKIDIKQVEKNSNRAIEQLSEKKAAPQIVQHGENSSIIVHSGEGNVHSSENDSNEIEYLKEKIKDKQLYIERLSKDFEIIIDANKNEIAALQDIIKILREELKAVRKELKK